MFGAVSTSFRSRAQRSFRLTGTAKSLNSKIDIEVDGGINAETARVSIQNGANILVAGTSIFKTDDYAKAIRDLRG